MHLEKILIIFFYEKCNNTLEKKIKNKEISDNDKLRYFC